MLSGSKSDAEVKSEGVSNVAVNENEIGDGNSHAAETVAKTDEVQADKSKQGLGKENSRKMNWAKIVVKISQ